MELFFAPKGQKIPCSSYIYIEFCAVYGLATYKYFLMLKGCGYYFVNKQTFSVLGINKLYWINSFLLNNFVFSTDLRLYNRGKSLQYLTYFNYKRSRILNRLPVRGQRTQTNSRTCKILNKI